MSEGNERFYDPSTPGKKALNEEGAEVEGHRHEEAGEDMPGKKGLSEDDSPEVEGHRFFDKSERFYKKG